jgi:hypothetical protein
MLEFVEWSIPNPDSKNFLYMDFDCLGKMNAIVKSNLQFETHQNPISQFSQN